VRSAHPGSLTSNARAATLWDGVVGIASKDACYAGFLDRKEVQSEMSFVLVIDDYFVN
jgi:hypothetical protein